MRVLIVGCGYVGLPLGTELVREGHEVFGLRRSARAEDKLKAAGIKPLKADITQPGDLAILPARFDWVINAVASGGGNVEDYRKVYLQGTRHLLTWMAAAPPAKYIYTSSTGVYGQNDGSEVTEASPAEPTTDTARVLAETEALLLTAARQENFPAIVVRVAGIYGPDRTFWVQRMLAGEARMEGKGDRILNMIHRDDVVGSVIAALKNGRAGEIYNASDDEPVRQQDFLEWLAAALGKPMPPSEPGDSAASRKRGLTSKRVSNRKLKRDLGYQLRYPSFREGYTADIQRSASQRDA